MLDSETRVIGESIRSEANTQESKKERKKSRKREEKSLFVSDEKKFREEKSELSKEEFDLLTRG